MNWEKKPVLLLVLATLFILVGTIVTMVLPFVWVNTAEDRIPEVKPYKALELAGRDVYIREGCNNCHSQTVRPLEADVKRYGPYSKSGEFVYDRPFLWGSRRMGPDLARLGGKYPDTWHRKHMVDPASVVPGSIMPAYAFLQGGSVDPGLTRAKMETLNFPYTEAEITGLTGKTEMDAIVAYMQKLGADLPRTKVSARVASTNPFAGNQAAAGKGKELFAKHCSSCHGVNNKGDLASEIRAEKYDDAKIFAIVMDGEPKEGMPSFSQLGSDRVWKVISYLKTGGK